MVESDGNTNGKITPIMLRDREVNVVRNWHEFLRLWNEAGTYKQMQALLLEGFDVPLGHYACGEPDYDTVDRLKFYFGVAEGWADCSLLETFPPLGWRCVVNGVERTQREVRQMVAETAFKQLCQNFFKKQAEVPLWDNRHLLDQGWVNVVASEQLLPVIMSFFKPEREMFLRLGRQVTIANLSRNSERQHPLEKYARDFLLRLQEFLWSWEEGEIQSWAMDPSFAEQKKISMRTLTDNAKVWMVEVLIGLGKLNRLWEVSGPRRDQFIELEIACLAKLEEVALHAPLDDFLHPVTKSRLVVTIGEAYLAGSTAARFLTEYMLKKREWERVDVLRQEVLVRGEAERRERERLDAIEKAEATRAKAERTLRELIAKS